MTEANVRQRRAGREALCPLPNTIDLAERLTGGKAATLATGLASWIWLVVRQLNVMSGLSSAEAGHWDVEATPAQAAALADIVDSITYFLQTPNSEVPSLDWKVFLKKTN